MSKTSILIKDMEMPASCIECRFGREVNYSGDFKEKCLVNDKYGYVSVRKPRLDTCPLIEFLKSVKPERKTGHWKQHNTYHGDDVSGFIDPDWRCSECGGQANVNAWCMYDLTDFCPNCGANMEGDAE